VRVGVDALGRPLDRCPRVIVECVSIQFADGGGIVIAAHADGPFRGQPGDYLIRLRPVTDDVTKLPYGVVGLQRVKHCLERGQIAVDIGEHGNPHCESG
jgi:hypothetical protein